VTIHVLTHRPERPSVVALRYAIEALGGSLSAGSSLPFRPGLVFEWGYRYDTLRPTLVEWCEIHGVALVNGRALSRTEPAKIASATERLFLAGDRVLRAWRRESRSERWWNAGPPRPALVQLGRATLDECRAEIGEVFVDTESLRAVGVRFDRPTLTEPEVAQGVARYLLERAARTERKLSGPVAVVTGLELGHAQVEELVSSLRERGHDAHPVRVVPVDARAAVFWRTTWRHQRRELLRAELLGIPTVQGVAQRIWEQRSTLHASGLRIPRYRVVTSSQGRARAAQWVGTPMVWTREVDPERIDDSSVAYDGREIPRSEGALVVEEALVGTRSPLACWVIGGRVLGCVGTPTRAERHEAEKAARALGLTVAEVHLVRVADGDPLVWRVLHRNLAAMPKALWPSARHALALALAGALPVSTRPRRTPASDMLMPGVFPGSRTLNVWIPWWIGARSNARRVWHIHALLQGLRRAGHEIRICPGTLAREGYDFVLQDPTEAIGRRIRSDEINGHLYRFWRRRGHLIRDARHPAPSNKLQMVELAARLRLRAPPTMRIDDVTPDDLPVIVKPVAGSLGVGVRLATRMHELPARGAYVAQHFVDAGIGHAVSIRVVTVRDLLVTAALFYRRGVRSNLSQGGSAIALMGPGARSRLLPRELWLLQHVGIDPSLREVPPEVARMARRIGRFYAARGVQMLGHDYVVDADQRWWFLEVNLAFGLRVFNVTHGGGAPGAHGCLRVAGDVLADGLVRALTQVTSTKRGDETGPNRSVPDLIPRLLSDPAE
jgi:hypothetical protein